MCIAIIWNNTFLVGGRARVEARIDPRPLQTSRSTAHGAQVVWPLDYIGRAYGLINVITLILTLLNPDHNSKMVKTHLLWQITPNTFADAMSLNYTVHQRL